MDFRKHFILLLNLFVFGLGQDEEEYDTRLKCPLVWQASSRGNSIPDSAVKAQGSGPDQTTQIVIRDNGYIVGRLDVDSKIPYISKSDNSGNAVIPSSYDILTNPHGCLTFWTNVDEQFRVNSGTSNVFVGRRQYDPFTTAGQWYSGHIKNDMISIPVPNIDNNGTEVVMEDEDFQYLTSYSIGLVLTVQDMVFDENELPVTPDFLSQDEIHNPSSAMVSQIITHEKQIRERLEITITNTTVSSSTKTIKKNYIIKKTKVEETSSYTRTESRTYITETLTNVSASLELIIPPGASVKACSLVDISEGVEIDYVATGVYSAAGLTPQVVYDLVKQEELPGLRFQSNLVSVPITGKMTVNLAMTTKFVVSSVDSEDNTCSPMMKRHLRK